MQAPNSSVNQYNVPNLDKSYFLAPQDNIPISYEISAISLSANKGTWPTNSCTISGSGVYSGVEWWRIYWVQQNTLWPKAFKNSL